MKAKLSLLLLVSLTIISAQVSAAMITNGNFSSCDFSGWQKDTDGFGDVSNGTDFQIRDTGTSCQGVINVDHFDPPGDLFGTALDEVFFANTLFQTLDLSAASSSTLQLDISFSVESEITSQDPAFVADYFLIGLFDGMGNYVDETGNLGFLVGPTDINGAMSQSLSFELDPSFFNQTNWSLDFQMNVGVDDFGLPDAFGSSFILESVSLSEIVNPTEVPEPFSLGLLALGLLGLRIRQTK